MFVETIEDKLNNCWVAILRDLEAEEAANCSQAFDRGLNLGVVDGSISIVDDQGSILVESEIGSRLIKLTVADEPNERSNKNVILSGLTERQVVLLKNCVVFGRVFFIGPEAILAIT